MKLPLYRAEHLDTEELVIGLVIEHPFLMFQQKCVTLLCEDDEEYICDYETLEISFDKGLSFSRLQDLEIEQCKDFQISYTNIKDRKCKITQPNIGKVFTILCDRGVSE